MFGSSVEYANACADAAAMQFDDKVPMSRAAVKVEKPRKALKSIVIRSPLSVNNRSGPVVGIHPTEPVTT